MSNYEECDECGEIFDEEVTAYEYQGKIVCGDCLESMMLSDNEVECDCKCAKCNEEIMEGYKLDGILCSDCAVEHINDEKPLMKFVFAGPDFDSMVGGHDY